MVSRLDDLTIIIYCLSEQFFFEKLTTAKNMLTVDAKTPAAPTAGAAAKIPTRKISPEIGLLQNAICRVVYGINRVDELVKIFCFCDASYLSFLKK